MWRTYDGMGALLDEAVLKAFSSEERAVGERHFCEEHPSKKQATPHTCFGKYCKILYITSIVKPGKRFECCLRLT